MKYLYAFFLCASLAAPAYAEQIAYTVRTTEVKQQPFSDAPTVVSLVEKTKVSIVTRQGGWVKISSNQNNGWVKMLSLRYTSTASKRGDSGLQSLFNVGRSGSSGITVATGVRGLSAEDLKSAPPNPRELEKLRNYTANKSDAAKFASEVNLQPQPLDYLPANGNR